MRKWLAQVPSVLREEAGKPRDSGRAFPSALHPRTGLSKRLRASTNRAKSREGASAAECGSDGARGDSGPPSAGVPGGVAFEGRVRSRPLRDGVWRVER